MHFNIAPTITVCYIISITFCNSLEGSMGRTKGAVNKVKAPVVYEMSPEERLELVAQLLIEIVSEELCTKE